MSISSAPAPLPHSLYLHIPFCLSKCPYCDFYSQIAQGNDIDRYVAAMCSDIAHSATGEFPLQPPGSVFSSVFFGGGTPSLLTPPQVARILNTAEQHYGFTNDVEISLEANPGTVTSDKLHGYCSAGVNRLSIGVQSFDDQQLLWLGRKHNSAQAIQTVEMARHAGFDNISLDLMFALANQTLPQLGQQCQQLHALSPEHISIYGLTIEEGTPFADQYASRQCQRPSEELPSENLYGDMFLLLHQQLSSLGYEHYEISNYARPGKRCRHNIGYWQRHPYLGIGAGAHSFYANNWGERWASDNSVTDYLNAIDNNCPPRKLIESFTMQQAMAESAYLALRCGDGINKQHFMANYNCRFNEQFASAIANCQPHIMDTDQQLSFTAEGWLIYNHLITNFL